jgi:hypothetical protein
MGNDAERTLALRGTVRLIGLDTSLASDRKVERYQEALRIAPNAAECKLLLSAVSQMPSVAAFRLAAGSVNDSRLRQEAEAAMLNIADGLTRTARREIVPELRQLMTQSSDTENVARARSLLTSIED